jgi:DHA1 family bicyclomycin/chloramphenicol resistance-like MFS transporter
VLRNPTFITSAVDVGVIYAVYLVFISVAPFVMSEMLGRPATEFGKYSLLVSAGYFLGNLYVARRGNARNMERLAQIGGWLQAGSAVLALAFVLAGLTHPIFWFGPMLPLAYGQGLILPHRTATAVRLVPGYAGVASSLIGFVQQLIAGASVQAIGFAPTDTPVPVLAFCAVLSVASLTTMLALRGHPAATQQR